MSDYNKEISEAKNTLSEVMTALNRENLTLEEKRAERKALEKENEELKADTKKAKEDTKKAKDAKIDAKEKLAAVENDVRKEEGALDDVLKRKIIAEKELADFKQKASSDIAVINEDRSTATINANLKKEQEAKEIKELEEKKALVILEIGKKEKALDVLTLSDSEKQSKIEDMDRTINSMTEEVSRLGVNVRNLKNAIIDSESVLESKKEKVKDIELEILSVEKEKDAVKKELEVLESEKASFIQGKMLLQKDKEELQNRELFIMEKYSQAGVAYKDEVTNVKGALAEKAELQQMKQDLDKRELFIREKYKKAGINYL